MAIKQIVALLCVFPFFSVFTYAQREETNFDRNWLFARYGLQADGSRIEESNFPQMPQFDDKAWRQLDLPHDWGIEGPFRSDLEGKTSMARYRLVPETLSGI